MNKFSIFDRKSLLYIFAFFDGLSVAAGALFGFFFPKLLSDVFGANFATNDLVWFQFVLLPGIAINILYMYFAITKNRTLILLSNILRTFTTVGFFLMWGEAVVLRSLLNLMIIHHIVAISITLFLYFRKADNKIKIFQQKKKIFKKTSLFLSKT
tara:strand:- start:17 stop:481 length:465 start_codon:yes stop_codon:yes gene_type:complete